MESNRVCLHRKWFYSPAYNIKTAYSVFNDA